MSNLNNWMIDLIYAFKGYMHIIGIKMLNEWIEALMYFRTHQWIKQINDKKHFT